MVKDKKNGQCFRADKLIEYHCGMMLDLKRFTKEEMENLERIMNEASSMMPE
jgi:glycyl-tRNA synthetase (class II)